MLNFYIGHSLFWNLRSEMYNPNVQQRFGLYLEVFLNKIGPDLRRVFEDEAWLIERLLAIADLPHDLNYKKNEFLLKQIYIDELETLNKQFKGREISMPLNYNMKVKRIVADKCKIMKSKKKPLWLVFKNAVCIIFTIYLFILLTYSFLILFSRKKQETMYQ